MMNREIEIQKITEYFDELLWEFEKLSKTELTFEQKTERIGEKLNLPVDFLLNWFNRNVSSSLSISEIKERLDNCIDLYTDLFCQKQEVYADGWIGNIKGGINCFADAYLSFEDIRIDLEMNMPKGEIWNWYWDNVENDKKAINYYSYALGLRISDIKEQLCDNPFCDKGNMFKKPDGEHFGCECIPNRD